MSTTVEYPATTTWKYKLGKLLYEDYGTADLPALVLKSNLAEVVKVLGDYIYNLEPGEDDTIRTSSEFELVIKDPETENLIDGQGLMFAISPEKYGSFAVVIGFTDEVSSFIHVPKFIVTVDGEAHQVKYWSKTDYDYIPDIIEEFYGEHLTGAYINNAEGTADQLTPFNFGASTKIRHLDLSSLEFVECSGTITAAFKAPNNPTIRIPKLESIVVIGEETSAFKHLVEVGKSSNTDKGRYLLINHRLSVGNIELADFTAFKTVGSATAKYTVKIVDDMTSRKMLSTISPVTRGNDYTYVSFASEDVENTIVQIPRTIHRVREDGHSVKDTFVGISELESIITSVDSTNELEEY